MDESSKGGDILPSVCICSLCVGSMLTVYSRRLVRKITGVTKVPFGDAVISTPDTCLGFETCQELFETQAPHLDMSLNGVEIMTSKLSVMSDVVWNP